MRKNLPKKAPTLQKPVSSLKTTPRMRSTATTPKNSSRIGSPDLSQPRAKVKTLQSELKELDLLRTLLTQWSFANSFANTALKDQTRQANEQIADRTSQIVDLKKQTLSLQAEYSAREKTQLVDQILNLQYSKLQSNQDSILFTSAYLQHIESLSQQSLDRVKLQQGVLINPYECLHSLDQANSAIRDIFSTLQQDIEVFHDLSQQMETLDFVLKEESNELEESNRLKEQLEEISERYRLMVVHSSVPRLHKKIMSLLEEPLT